MFGRPGVEIDQTKWIKKTHPGYHRPALQFLVSVGRWLSKKARQQNAHLIKPFPLLSVGPSVSLSCTYECEYVMPEQSGLLTP